MFQLGWLDSDGSNMTALELYHCIRISGPKFKGWNMSPKSIYSSNCKTAVLDAENSTQVSVDSASLDLLTSMLYKATADSCRSSEGISRHSNTFGQTDKSTPWNRVLADFSSQVWITMFPLCFSSGSWVKCTSWVQYRFMSWFCDKVHLLR